MATGSSSPGAVSTSLAPVTRLRRGRTGLSCWSRPRSSRALQTALRRHLAPHSGEARKAERRGPTTSALYRRQARERVAQRLAHVQALRERTRTQERVAALRPEAHLARVAERARSSAGLRTKAADGAAIQAQPRARLRPERRRANALPRNCYQPSSPPSRRTPKDPGPQASTRYLANGALPRQRRRPPPPAASDPLPARAAAGPLAGVGFLGGRRLPPEPRRRAATPTGPRPLGTAGASRAAGSSSRRAARRRTSQITSMSEALSAMTPSVEAVVEPVEGALGEPGQGPLDDPGARPRRRVPSSGLCQDGHVVHAAPEVLRQHDAGARLPARWSWSR
jgi:hypothetical protein